MVLKVTPLLSVINELVLHIGPQDSSQYKVEGNVKSKAGGYQVSKNPNNRKTQKSLINVRVK